MMKLNKKTINIAAGAIFLLQAVDNIRGMIALATNGVLFQNIPITLVLSLYGTVVLSIMGVQALRQKVRGKMLSYMGAIYIGYTVANMFYSIRAGLNVVSLLMLVLLIAAFCLTQKDKGGSVFQIKDTNSEAAKMQAQSEKQTTIYDEQLRDGILTQEEYDQIMQNK